MFIRPGNREPQQDLKLQQQTQLAAVVPVILPPQNKPGVDTLALEASTLVSTASPVLVFFDTPTETSTDDLHVFITQLAQIPLQKLTEQERQLVFMLRQLVESAAQGDPQALLLLSTGEQLLKLALSDPQAAQTVYALLAKMSQQQLSYSELDPASREALHRIGIHTEADLARLGGIVPLWHTAQAMAGAVIEPEQFSAAYRQHVLPLVQASCLNGVWSRALEQQAGSHQTPKTALKASKSAVPSSGITRWQERHGPQTSTNQTIERMLTTAWQQRKQQLETEQQQRLWSDQKLLQQRERDAYTTKWLEQLTEDRQALNRRDAS